MMNYNNLFATTETLDAQILNTNTVVSLTKKSSPSQLASSIVAGAPWMLYLLQS